MATSQVTESWRTAPSEDGNNSATSRRWQGDSGNTPAASAAKARGKRRRATVLSLLLTVVLLAWLVYLLLYNPLLTPTVTMTATGYDWPYPPNAWAMEDVVALADLDRQNVRQFDISDSTDQREKALAALAASLKTASEKDTEAACVVVYISMFGAVNDQGTPCLLPPDADPFNPASWIKVSDLLQTVVEHSSPANRKLIVLDACRYRSDWKLGIVYNTFAERLHDVAADFADQRVTLLTSAGEGQMNPGSSDLRSTPFGYFFKLGLAGAADVNRDNSVSVKELHRYLGDRVGAWSMENFGRPQQPQLLPASTNDFHVAWSVRQGMLRRLQDAASSTMRPPPSIATERIGDLWQKMARLKLHQPLRFAPLTWHRWQNKLLQLEMLADAGIAYAGPAQRTERDLAKELDSALSRAAAATSESSIVARSAVFTDDLKKLPELLRPCTLSEGMFFGTVSPLAAERARAAIQNAIVDRQATRLETMVETTVGAPLPAEWIDQFYFLRTAAELQVPQQQWDNGSLQELLALRTRSNRLAGVLTGKAADGLRFLDQLQAGIADGDQYRRRAEDRFLAVSDPSLIRTEILAANERLGEAEELAKRLAEAATVYEAACAELPVYAHWLSQRHDLEARDNLLTKVLLPTIAANQRLGEPSGASATALLESAASVREGLDQLKSAFDRECRFLSESDQRDADVRQRLEFALQSPNASWELRLALKKRLVAVARQLAQGFHDTKKKEAAGDASETPSGDLTEQPTAWEVQPLLAMIGGPEPAAKEAADETTNGRLLHLEAVNQQARRSLLDAAIGIAGDPSVRLTTEPNRQVDPIAADFQARRSAAWFIEEIPQQTPSDRRLRHELQQLLLFSGERALDDFLGPLSEGDESFVRQFFFERAANNCFGAVEELLPAAGAVDARLQRNRQLLANRLAAARDGISITAESTSLIDLADQPTVDVELRPTNAMAHFPQGFAAIAIQDGARLRRPSSASSTNPTATAGSIPVPLADNRPLKVGLVMPEIDQGNPARDVLVVFRGHRFAAPFLLQSLGGLVIDHRPHRYGPPQVTLFGDRRQRASIVFVLDCSASMSEPILVESLGSEQRQRLDLAKSALEAMLIELAQRGDTRVGVRFFGHRVGWSTSRPVQMVASSSYSGDIPAGLLPSRDVESVLTLGRFDSVEAGNVIRRMRSVQPLGQSPLNLALIEALGDFAKDDRDTEKSIIVITDGVNYQFTPASVDNRDTPPTTVTAALAAWEKYRVPIHILGFGVAEAEVAEAEREFRRIADRTGGSYHPVSNGMDLLRAIRNQLGLGGYYLQDSEGRVVSGTENGEIKPVRLNVPVTPDTWDGKEQTFVVHFQQVRRAVQLAGGEALELMVTSDGGDIQAIPFDGAFPVAGELTAGEAGLRTGYVVRCHRPLRQQATVRFPLSWQDQRSHFTERLQEAWITITPVDAEGVPHPTSYLFYDLNYEPRKPVPVVELAAHDWPAMYNQARIEVWCKLRPSTADESIQMSEVAAAATKYSKGIRLPAFPGIILQLRRSETSNGDLQIDVTERHEGASSVDAMKVRCALPAGTKPARVTHRFDAEHGIVTHTFMIAAADRTRVEGANGASIEFIRRETIQDGAWQLERGRPLNVEIYDASNVFPVEAAAGASSVQD